MKKIFGKPSELVGMLMLSFGTFRSIELYLLGQTPSVFITLLIFAGLFVTR